MDEKLYLYPVWVRVWHWVNALLFLVLIVTGLSMQYSSPEYPLIRFDWAVSLHNTGGILLTASYIYFLFANSFTGNAKYYRIYRKGLTDRLKKQFRYYLIGVFRNEKPPFPVNSGRKFNPLQKLSYSVVMYVLMPLIIITGFALLFPEMIFTRVFGISGIHLTDLFHIFIGFVLSIFMFVHIYFCTFGKTASSNFKSMINGWH